MKQTYLAAASSLVLALALASGPSLAQQQGQSAYQGQAQKSQQESRVDDITGTKVVNDTGEEIGEVEEIVRDPQTNKLHAVVSVGGFLGIGEKNVTVAAQDLKWQGDRLLAPGSSEEQLKNRPEYTEGQFQKLSDDQMVSMSGSKADQQGGQQMSFSQLDRNQDGFISQQEAQMAQNSQLTQSWSQLDQNSDQRLDQGEFAAFETMSGQQGGKERQGGSY